jgi:hypothetical protein
MIRPGIMTLRYVLWKGASKCLGSSGRAMLAALCGSAPDRSKLYGQRSE